jgi:electron transfer flavoprotein beta subunit
LAIEAGLQLKEKAGGGEVIIVSMGPARAVEAIRTGLAMGGDRGIHVDDTGITADSSVTAKVLANALKNENVNVVFTGKQAIDDDAGQVSQMVAEFLNFPQVMIIEKLELNADKSGATVHRRVGGGTKEIYEVTFPALFGCEKGLNTPRYASLPGIMKAKTKPLAVVKATDLVGEAKPKTAATNYRLPPERQAGKIFKGEPDQVVKELVKALREEAKVI